MLLILHPKTFFSQTAQPLVGKDLGMRIRELASVLITTVKPLTVDQFLPVRSERTTKKMTSTFRSKCLTIVHGFGQKLKILTLAKKRIPSERACQEEQNDANFSFVSPSSEE